MTKVACILVHYRYLEDTLDCFRSLAEAGLSGFKLFVINNHPSDGSGRTLQTELQKMGMPFVYLEADENLGFAGGVNLGLKGALSEEIPHIIVLNNDIEVVPDFTAEVLRMIREYPREVLAGKVLDAVTQKPTYNIGRCSPWNGRIRHIFDPDYKGRVEFISGGLIIVPAWVFGKVGLLDKRFFMYCEDMELCLRFRDHGIPIRFCPSVVIHHKVSSSTTKSQTPREYYIMRNESYILLRRGPAIQKVFYAFFLLVAIPYKAMRRPRLFPQVLLGIWDGANGKLGRKGI
jgi:GT2 family glycosyltransferase